MTTVTSADKVLLQGSVMDMSPGETNTPAVSDASMTTWMDFLFGQNAQLINSQSESSIRHNPGFRNLISAMIGYS